MQLNYTDKQTVNEYRKLMTIHYPSICELVGLSKTHENKIFKKSKFRWKPRNIMTKNNNFKLLNLDFNKWTDKDLVDAKSVIKYLKKS